MKRSHFWFMLEGLFCGVLQILMWECTVSVWARPWMRVALPIFGVMLSAVGFFFLMRRFPATKKKKKFALSVLFWIVIMPAWVVYGRAFGLAIFPHRVMAAAEYASLLVQFLSWYAAGLAVTRLGIILYYYILKKKKKRAR